MKLAMTHRKPRNPLVAHARFRQAGRHLSGDRSRRRDERALLREPIPMTRHSP